MDFTITSPAFAAVHTAVRHLLYGYVSTRFRGYPLRLNHIKNFWTFPSPGVIMSSCRYGSSVERQLPKLERGVRFPLSAFLYLFFGSVNHMPFIFLGKIGGLCATKVMQAAQMRSLHDLLTLISCYSSSPSSFSKISSSSENSSLAAWIRAGS